MKPYTFLKIIIFGTLSFLVILLILVLFPFGSEVLNEQPELINENAGCIRVVDEVELEFAGCYDAFSKKVFFEIKNNQFTDSSAQLRTSYFDYAQNNVDLIIPERGKSSFIKLDAGRNPLSVEIYLESNVINYCNLPYDLPIEFCPASLSDEISGSQISLVTSVRIENFTDVGSTQGSDIISTDSVDPEQIWETICASNWDCDDWTTCVDGTQKRSCVDRNNCAIPTGIPKKVRACDNVCVEDWKCTWSQCNDGYTTPSCVDENGCGTQLDLPQKIQCARVCTPDIVCGGWDSCQASYDFLTLQNHEMSGLQSRVCVDRNNCVPNAKEYRSCSLEIDVYTRGFEKCGKQYVGVYDSEENILLANVEKDDDLQVINVDLSGELSKFYCDYCFDGLLNGDEEEIDCGGSCSPCEERQVDSTYSENFVERFIRGFIDFLR